MKIVRLLEKNYPNARTALKFSDPWQLLVATVLSAQCTDKRVNIVTESLFRKYRTVEDFARAEKSEFEKEIRSTGFFRNKAKNIVAAAQKILADFGGKVPEKMEDLLSLPGVARKTANIIAYNGFGKVYGIPVDTHVKRLSFRLGLSKEKDPVKIERDLMKIFPEKKWGKISYLLIEHGRAVCSARRPNCQNCFLKKICPKIGVKNG